MSQDASDYTVVNATGALVRGDINDILGDIRTMNSGVSGPSTTNDFLLWGDSTNDQMNVSYGGAWNLLAIDPTVTRGLTGPVIVNDGPLIVSTAYYAGAGQFVGLNSGTDTVLSMTTTNSAAIVGFFHGDNSAYGADVVRIASDEEATGSFYFLRCFSDWDSSAEIQFSIDQAGDVRAASFVEDGSDYAEAFEWADGNPDNEDRVALAVVIEGDLIRFPAEGEEPDGVVSSTPGSVANAAARHWSGKYKTDDFGRRIGGRETINPAFRPCDDPALPRQIEETKPVVEVDRKGRLVPKLDADRKQVFETKLVKNPAYYPDHGYKPRLERPEWDAVGLLGRLPLRKGQPVAPRWKKLKDMTEDVELWLVR